MEDGFCPAEIDIDRRQIAQAFVVPVEVVVVDDLSGGPLKRAGQVVVFEQDAVLHRLVPALNLALHLGMVRRPADVIHATVFETLGQVAGDVTAAIVGERARPVGDDGRVATRCHEGIFRGGVTSFALMVVQSRQAMTCRL